MSLSLTSVVIAVGVVLWVFVKPDLPLHIDKLVDNKESAT